MPVFPTQVGMFPTLRHTPTRPCGFPHAGGDVSVAELSQLFPSRFSPRRWGCFPERQLLDRGARVFPTQVGMFPAPTPASRSTTCFPHAGGDVSRHDLGFQQRSWFSPRRWGCFQRRTLVLFRRIVFPTQVGMFLRCWHGERWRQQFSPRRWGCFFRFLVGQVTASVFPTQVGMFRKARRP